MQATNLNDLRFISVLAATGTLAGAARKLAVNHVTAFRRLAALEQALGVRLFERSAGRYTPTAAGEELARAGTAVDEIATDCLRRVAGRDLRPSGLVRVTTTDTIAQGLMAELFSAFRLAHPEIELHVIATNEFHDLSKRHADIAIRPSTLPPDHLIGRRIGKLAYAVYAHKRLVKKVVTDFSSVRWIALDESLSQHRSLSWLAKRVTADAVVFRTNSFTGVLQAVRAGIGYAVLPCFLGDRNRDLRRGSDVLSEITGELWLLTHPDLRDTPRVRSAFDFFGVALKANKGLLEGRLAP